MDSIPIITDEQQIGQVLHEQPVGNIHNYNEDKEIQSEEEMETIPISTPTSELRRKRQVRRSNWKSSVRKQKYQSGQEYISKRGKVVPKKQILNKKDCLRNCKFNCARLSTEDERKEIFNSYYTLDQNAKLQFLLKTTERNLTKRPKKEPSRRSFTFKYFFDVHDDRFAVCKNYYLGTLNISQKPI